MIRSTLHRRRFIANSVAAASLSAVASAADNDTPDICIYGGTASGVMAAVTAAKQGRSVVLIEPSRWLGGMTGGGLSHVDWGREKAVGGTALSILSKNYDDAQYRQVFRDLVKKYRIRVIYEHRVSAVEKDGASIRSITLDHAPPDALGCPVAAATKANAMTIAAQVFIDCSYEGDLMARGGVSYTWGRESRDEYGESLAGVRPNLAVYAIDPYVTPGDAKSGLLPFIQDMQAQPEGSADRLTMGYGFRWKFSKDADRIPIDPPEHYDPKQWELYRRGFKTKAGIDVGRRMKGKLGFFEEAGGRIHSLGAGNLARALLAPTNYGSNAAYPDGDYATRARIWKADQEFMRGMTHFLRTDDCVPDKFKQTALEFGFQRGIFDDTHGWPHQLYVREARRMKSDYVLTQKDLEGSTDPADSIGLASYGVDDWPYATYVHEGKVALYGGEFSMLYLDEKHEGIYKIPYRAITPKQSECTNLLVPVCVSASHIAMTSIRMEPVWMILGESAGVAAAMAVAENLPVQQVPYAVMKEKLLALKQKLERPV
ncbi:MAG: FAD-dependent oxidoreductase [Verrucomicrobiaceae bacterium]|nr:FAD-dependent oxidoreductase [Verrucomicrobiaceae bacterium]